MINFDDNVHNSFLINLYDDINGIYNPRTYTLAFKLVYVPDRIEFQKYDEGDN